MGDIIATFMRLKLLVVSRLTKKVKTPHGDLIILDDINISINKSESIAIIGASGSGKSTLLSLLAGLDTVSSGSISLAGAELTSMDEEARAKLRQDKIGFIFQAFQLIPSLSALDNVMLPMELKGEKKPRDTAISLLQRVGLSQRMEHTPLQLSGGEQQRVAIARAFAGDPEILFADEPTGNLDQNSGKKIIELLFEMNREKSTTLVMVTHDMQLAMRCDRQLELDFGRLKLDPYQE